MPSVTVSFSLNPEQHVRILEWLAGQENASQAVREVLDAHVRAQVRLADVYRELRSLRQDVAALERRGLAVVVDGQEEAVAGDEPEAATMALDALGKD